MIESNLFELCRARAIKKAHSGWVKIQNFLAILSLVMAREKAIYK